jgi:hypothetical protein
MVNRMKINLDEYKKYRQYVHEIEKADLSDIEIDGIEITDIVRKEWTYVGMNNRHFIEMLIDANDEGQNPLQTIWDTKEED